MRSRKGPKRSGRSYRIKRKSVKERGGGAQMEKACTVRCFDIITDALTNARLRRQESARKLEKSWSTHETWLPSRQRKTGAQKN